MGTWVVSTWNKYKWCIYLFLVWKIVSVALIYVFYGLYHVDEYDYLNLRFYINGPLLPFSFWDGQHYLKLAEVGYSEALGMSRAFYPLFPLSIRLVHFLVPDLMLSGVIAATLFSLLFMLSLYRLALLFLEPFQARRAVVLSLLFPTSIYLTVIYTEGLFLFLLCTFLFLYFQKNPWCILFAVLLPLTRGQGLFLIPAVAAMFLYRLVARKPWKEMLFDLQVLGGFVVGYLALLFVSWHATGDPYMVFHAQDEYYQYFDASIRNLLNPLHLLSVMTVITNKWLIPDIILIYLMLIGTYFVLRLKNPMILFCYLVLIYLPAAMGIGWSYRRFALLGVPFLYLGILHVIGSRKRPYVLLGWIGAILQIPMIFGWSAKLFLG